MTDTPAPTTPDSSASIWARYRTLPMWQQIGIPVVIVGIVILLIVLFSGSGDDSASSETTVPASTGVDDVMKGIIIIGGVTSPSTTTTLPASTTAAASTTVAVSTTGPATTTGATVAPTVAPTTTVPASTTTLPAAAALPSAADFVTQWNAAITGTDVPEISASQATELIGDYAGYFLVELSPATGSNLPAQVGLLAQLTAAGSGQLQTISLVWIPGTDDTASDFFWESFGVLTQAITPGTTADETNALETTLGKAPGTPPFTTAATATSTGGNVYDLFTQPYDSPATGSIDVSVIRVS